MGSHVGADITQHEVLQVDSSLELCSTSTATIKQCMKCLNSICM